MVAQCCKAVIACRARKDQKAKLTRLVRKGNHEVVTLGIGDGANDVEMIRAAHIGVGIIGKEGTQAVNNADYAISQFRYLTRLILVYGHHDYRGITLAALSIFYKNIIFTLVQFCYTFLCGLSGMRNQCFFAVMFYNTLFTAVLPFYLAVFDKDISDQNCYRFSQIHRQGITHSLFTLKRFALYSAKAVFESLVITFGSFWCVQSVVFETTTIEMYAYGMVVITIAILVANLSMSLWQATSNWISVAAFWLALVCWLGGVLVISQFKTLMPYYYMYFSMVFGNVNTYLIVLLVAAIAILPSMMIEAVRIEYTPSLVNMIQEVQLRHADANELKNALNERSKRRGLEQELSTIKALPHEASLPQLLQDDAYEEKMKAMKEQSIRASLRVQQEQHHNPYDLLCTGNTYKSIRSMAGMRALAICKELHGPSYDAQSEDEPTQSVLLERINSHRWRVAKKTGIMDTIKTSIQHAKDVTLNSLKEASATEESVVAASANVGLETIEEDDGAEDDMPDELSTEVPNQAQVDRASP